MQEVPLIDTHAHLDLSDYDLDRDEVIARAGAAGLVAIVTIGIEPAYWDRTVAIANDHPEVYTALGIHPNSADQTNATTLNDLAAMISHFRFSISEARQIQNPKSKIQNPKTVAIGETGLDYYREYVPQEAQRESFRAHLDLARQLDLPVIIHNR